MKTTQKISLDFTQRGFTEWIAAVQGDSYTREVELSLYSDGQAWTIPDGVSVRMRYRLPDGTGDAYDALPDGSPFWTASENILTAVLAPQMLVLAGLVEAQIQITSGDETVATFSFIVAVEPDPSAAAPESQEAVTWANWTKTELEKMVKAATKYKETAENVELPLTITSGKALFPSGDEHSLAEACYGSASVTPGDIIQVTGYQWRGDNFGLCYFYDANGVRISTYDEWDGTDKAVSAEIVVPENAASISVNGHLTYSPVSVVLLGGEIVHTMETIVKGAKALEANVNELQEDVEQLQVDMEDKASVDYVDEATVAEATIADHKYELTRYDRKIIYANTGSVGTLVSSYYVTTTVTPGDTIQITGYNWPDTNAAFCLFKNSSGETVAKLFSDGSDSTKTLKVVVPKNAVELWVNGRLTYSGVAGMEVVITGEYTGIVPLTELYSELYNEVEALKGKPAVKPKLMTLGDSITALGTGDRGWVKYFMEKTRCTLVVNTAVNGAWLMDKAGTVYDGNPVFNGDDQNINNVLGNQVQKIINNGYEAPDIIIISIGTNGGISITKEQIRAAYYDNSNALIPLENVDRTTSAGAYRWCLEKLHDTYPNAQIFWCTPIMGYQGTRSADNAMNYAESLRIATEYTGQIMIDTIRCGINGVNEVSDANGQYLIDGLHPNVNGAKKIGYYNASRIMPFLGNSFEIT